MTWVRGRGNLLSRPADVRREAQWVLAGELIRDGYVLDRRGPALLYSPTINEALRHGADARYELLGRRRPPAPTGLPAAVILQEHVRSGAVLSDGAKVSLTDDLRLVGGTVQPVRLRESRYFDGLITNDFARRDLCRRDGEVLFRGESVFVDGDRILPLRESTASNGIGVSTLALTRDDVLIISRQGPRSAVWASLLVPSGSGSADRADAVRTRSLRQLVVGVAERELLEECGLPVDVPRHTVVLAYARLLARGGKPEFFCFTRLDASYEEVHVRRRERSLVLEHEALRIGDRAGFRDGVAQFFDERAPSLSTVLRAHAVFLDQALAAGWTPFSEDLRDD